MLAVLGFYLLVSHFFTFSHAKAILWRKTEKCTSVSHNFFFSLFKQTNKKKNKERKQYVTVAFYFVTILEFGHVGRNYAISFQCPH